MKRKEYFHTRIHILKLIFSISLLMLVFTSAAQNRYDVASLSEYDAVHDAAVAGDSIVWAPGIYENVRIDVTKDSLIVTALPYGSAMFTGLSRVVIDGDRTVFSGFQYVGGNISTLHVVSINGSDVLFTQNNIEDYTSYKYLIVDEASRRTTISHCNFENRLNLDDQNILSVLVDEDEPGYHLIQYCSFKNFEGTGNDLGIEPIRIGVSTQAEFDSRTIVEYCYFTNCDGDGELISNKASQNVLRYNTFENNTKAELVLRHGDEAIVYGNFFLNNMGGIRVREGSNHFIYNNYFEGNDRRSIYLQNESSDPLSDIHLYFNTIVRSAEVILGSSGSHPPANVTLANNIFYEPEGQLFTEATETENWIGNISLGTLGIDRPSEGLIETDPNLIVNEEGYLQPATTSAAKGAAQSGFPVVPSFQGLVYDSAIVFDIMKSSRPDNDEEKTVGASEINEELVVRPHVVEENSGPSYLFDNPLKYTTTNVSSLLFPNSEEVRQFFISSNQQWSLESSEDWISLSSASGMGDAYIQVSAMANQLQEERTGLITINSTTGSFSLEVSQNAGDPPVLSLDDLQLKLYPNPSKGSILLELPQDAFGSLHLELFNLDGQRIYQGFYEETELAQPIELGVFTKGIYLLKAYFNVGTPESTSIQKIVIE